jgi:hypothetical protein
VPTPVGGAHRSQYRLGRAAGARRAVEVEFNDDPV